MTYDATGCPTSNPGPQWDTLHKTIGDMFAFNRWEICTGQITDPAPKA